MNTTDGRTKTALFCISPLVQGIATDLGSLNGFFPSDVVELALDILTSEAENDYTLNLVFSDSRCAATQEAIREACRQTELYHFLMRVDNDEHYSELLARGETDNGTVFANRIVAEILARGGRMNVAVEIAVSRTFDPRECINHSPSDLVRFFWKTFNIEVDEFDRLVLD